MSKTNPNILDRPIVGQRIVGIRKLTKAEMDLEGWDWGSVTALVLDDGTLLYASQDEEGNGPGMLFGRKGTNSFRLFVKT